MPQANLFGLTLLPRETQSFAVGGPGWGCRPLVVSPSRMAAMKRRAATEGMPAHFAGHETFPLRQMWLKKAYDQANAKGIVPRSTFSDEQAIADFGVGKNMVASIRHWALACDVIREAGGDYALTPIGKAILDDGGWDPFSENPTTAWYCHWCLAGRGTRATTWYWLFNHVTASSFTREDLASPLAEYAKRVDANRRLSPLTFARDIETCLRGYAPRVSGASPEDYAEPMLGELGLLYEERKGHFAFRRGPKATLHDGMFAFALLDFWDRTAPGLSALAFETIAYGEGSPGRVFKLDEDSVAERLFNLADLTRGTLSWTDTAGLRQVHRLTKSENIAEKMIEKAYG